jgi:hypothetical protein
MMMTKPTIELAKELQRTYGLQSHHLVWIGEDGFTIAHTDQERRDLLSLEECALHLWLSLISGPPTSVGWHVAKHIPYPGFAPEVVFPEWTFLPLDDILTNR